MCVCVSVKSVEIRNEKVGESGWDDSLKGKLVTVQSYYSKINSWVGIRSLR